jgi:TolB-like protein
MPGTPPKVARYCFGSFDLDPEEGTLARNGIHIRLQDFPFRLLLMLVERAGEIVTREEMRQLVIAAGLVFRFRGRPLAVSGSYIASRASPIHVRRSVAVLGFRNLAGRREDQWFSPVFSEMLNTELGTHGDLRVVSGEDVDLAKRELPLTEEDSLAKGTLERLRINPGADYVVLGSYTLMEADAEKRIRLDLRLQDTADGETIAEEAITGNENNLFDLAAQAGGRLRQRLGLRPNSTGDSSAARQA